MPRSRRPRSDSTVRWASVIFRTPKHSASERRVASSQGSRRGPVGSNKSPAPRGARLRGPRRRTDGGRPRQVGHHVPFDEAEESPGYRAADPTGEHLVNPVGRTDQEWDADRPGGGASLPQDESEPANAAASAIARLGSIGEADSAAFRNRESAKSISG